MFLHIYWYRTCWSAAPRSWRAPPGTRGRPCWWSPRTLSLARPLRQILQTTFFVLPTCGHVLCQLSTRHASKLICEKWLGHHCWQMENNTDLTQFAAISESIFDDLSEQRPLHTIAVAATRWRGGSQASCCHKVLSSQVTKMFPPPPPPLLRVSC